MTVNFVAIDKIENLLISCVVTCLFFHSLIVQIALEKVFKCSNAIKSIWILIHHSIDKHKSCIKVLESV